MHVSFQCFVSDVLQFSVFLISYCVNPLYALSFRFLLTHTTSCTPRLYKYALYYYSLSCIYFLLLLWQITIILSQSIYRCLEACFCKIWQREGKYRAWFRRTWYCCKVKDLRKERHMGEQVHFLKIRALLGKPTKNPWVASANSLAFKTLRTSESSELISAFPFPLYTVSHFYSLPLPFLY